MSLKREIFMLASEKGLEDLDHMTDVCLVDIPSLESFPDKACWLNTCERLRYALLNAIKHPSDDG